MYSKKLLIFITLLVACSTSPKPEEIAEKYIQATLELDFEAMKELCSEKSKGRVDVVEKLLKMAPGGETGGLLFSLTTKTFLNSEIKETQIEGNSASVQISYQFEMLGLKKEIDQEINLVKEDKVWKVDCMNLRSLLNF